jgi:ABC-type transport system involved in multi-copper enzyme maturation permease subunit
VIDRIYGVALNTFREAIRQRVLYGILAVVFGLNLFAIVLGAMSLHEEARVARDVGLGGISLFGSLTAIVLGVSLLYVEIQRRTIHTIVSKPLERWEFVVGKYTGMALTLTVLVMAFTMAMLIVLALQEVPISIALFKAVALAYIEVMVVAALAIFFSSFSSPYLSGVFTFGLFLAGRLSAEMRQAADSSSSPLLKEICHAALWVVPDLTTFSVSGGEVAGGYVSVHGGEFVSWPYLLHAAGYGVLYVAALLLLAITIFSRRDFV